MEKTPCEVIKKQDCVGPLNCLHRSFNIRKMSSENDFKDRLNKDAGVKGEILDKQVEVLDKVLSITDACALRGVCEIFNYNKNGK